MTSTTALTSSLMLYRSTYAGATRLAARIWPLVEALHASRMWLPREAALRYLSHAIYCNAGFDACVNYASPEDFAEELRADLESGWPNLEMVDGIEYHVVRPFFGDIPYLTEAGIGSLRACALSEISALKVAARECGPSAAVTGLADEELFTLIDMHRSGALAIINATRYLTTALTYPTSALSRMDNIRHEMNVLMAPDVSERLAGLTAALVLPGVEAPIAYFGSEWDKKGRVIDLAADSTLASFLRDC